MRTGSSIAAVSLAGRGLLAGLSWTTPLAELLGAELAALPLLRLRLLVRLDMVAFSWPDE
jgi:hypothetical protein